MFLLSVRQLFLSRSPRVYIRRGRSRRGGGGKSFSRKIAFHINILKS